MTEEQVRAIVKQEIDNRVNMMIDTRIPIHQRIPVDGIPGQILARTHNNDISWVTPPSTGETENESISK